MIVIVINFLKNILGSKKREIGGGDALDINYTFDKREEVRTSYQAMSIAAVYRCVKLLSDSVAQLPLRYMKNVGGIYVEEKTERNLHYFLTVQPCRSMSAFDMWAYVTQCLLLEGNAYIIPYRINGDIVALLPVSPRSVAHDTVNDTYNVYDANVGVNGKFQEWEVIHFKNISYDGKVGVGVIESARRSFEIAANGDEESLNQMSNGGAVRGIISNPTGTVGFGDYADKELESLAQKVDSRFRTGRSRIVMIPGNAQFTALSLSAADQQFLQSRQFTVKDICRFFGVNPSFVFEESGANYKSAEMANVAFLSNTLNPLLRRIENEMNRKLVPQSLCCARRFEFDREELYACDLASRVQYQTQTIGAGIRTINEWRRKENMPAVEGGDTPVISANYKSLQNLINENTNTNNNNGEKQ